MPLIPRHEFVNNSTNHFDIMPFQACYVRLDKKRLPSELAGLLTNRLNFLMDRTTHTTRKGFLQRAGLAIAGAFAVTGTSNATTTQNSKGSVNGSTGTNAELPAMSRIRTAKGAVERNSAS